MGPITSAFLSKPAASPIGLGSLRPERLSVTARRGSSIWKVGRARPVFRAYTVSRCAVSAGSMRIDPAATSKILTE
jgi:hypothetical protein